MNRRKLVITSTIPILVLLLGVGVGDKTANAWDGGCNWKIGPDSYDNGRSAGEQEAIYDHENQIAYNPYPQSCQSEVYQPSMKDMTSRGIVINLRYQHKVHQLM